MTTRPTHTPGWATGGANPVTSPTGSERSAGWAARQRVPASLLNGILQESDEWVGYLDSQSLRRFATLEDMWTDGSVATGDTFAVNEPAADPGGTSLVAIATDPTGLAADGRRVYVQGSGLTRAVSRQTGASQWTVGGGADPGGGVLATDGATIVRRNSASLVIIASAATGIASATYALGGTVNTLAVLGDRLAIGGTRVAGDGTASLRVVATSGAWVWSDTAIADLEVYSVCMWGPYVWAGAFDGTDHKLRRYSRTSASSPLSATWGSGAVRDLVCDGDRLYVGMAHGTNSLSAVGIYGGSYDIHWQVSITSGVDLVCCDDRYLYAHQVGSTEIQARCKLTGRLLAIVDLGGANNIVRMACDGQYLYVGRAGAVDAIIRVTVGRRPPRIWQRANTTDTYRPFPWAVTPGGA